jgi:serine protease Do
VVEQPGWHITYNVVVNESVQSWGGDQWTFDGSRGDWVRINMRSSNMDTYLELYDPFGNLLAQDDDSGDGTNARIYVDSLPFNGVYTIVARGFDGDTGSYQLQLE